MESATTTRVKHARPLRPLDIILIVLFLAICGFLLNMLLSQMKLNHEVSAAKAITNRVISDIGNQNANDVHSLGDSGFQKSHSTASLAALFKQVKSHAHGAPIADKQIVNNDKYGQAVGIIYKYPDKPQFYIRVVATKPKGASSWHLTQISGNTSESALLK